MLPKLPKDVHKYLLLQERAKRLWQNPTQWVMSITTAGMILALTADILIASKLGASTLADTLFIALTLPRIIEIIIREGTKFSLVSLLTDIKQKNNEDEFLEYVSMLFNLGLVFSSLVMVLGWIFPEPAIRLTGPGLTESAVSQAIFLFRLSLPLVLFGNLSTVLSVFLNSQKHFVVTATRNTSIPTAIIILMFIYWQNSHIITYIVIGHTIGYLCYFIYLLVYCFIKTDFKFNWHAWPNRTNLALLNQAIVYPSLGLTLRQSLRITEGALASLVAPGGVAAYYFAYRLISSLQTIFGVSIATTKLPEMSRQASRQNRRKFEGSLFSQTWKILFFSLPVTFIILLFHEQIIELLYGRGTFNDSSVALTGQILQVLGISVFFLSLIPMLNAGLYALQKYNLVLWNQLLTTVLNMFFAWYLSILYGIIGIAISLVLATVASVIVQLLMLHYNRLPEPIQEV